MSISCGKKDLLGNEHTARRWVDALGIIGLNERMSGVRAMLNTEGNLASGVKSVGSSNRWRESGGGLIITVARTRAPVLAGHGLAGRLCSWSERTSVATGGGWGA
jgi:hypothetical protein